MLILVLKVLFLFVSVWFSIVNTSRLIGRNDIPGSNFVYQAIGITGFITVMFLI